MVRTFFGIPLDAETHSALGREIDRLKRQAPKVRWVDPEKLHITIKFIGNVVPNELPELFAAADTAAQAIAPFLLDLEGHGCFPHARRPRVIWAGCGTGSDACVALARQVEEACAALGYKREPRPYTPHITIGRVKTPRQADGLRPLLSADEKPVYGTVNVHALVVFMSELKKNGAVYTPMHRAPLGG